MPVFVLGILVFSYLVFPTFQSVWGSSANVLMGTMVVQGLAWVYLLQHKEHLPLKGLLLGGVLAFLAARSVPPIFEDDYFRYFWDANQTLNNLRPYAASPATAPAFGLEELREKISFSELVTFYPPVAQFLFAVFFFVSGGWLPLFLFLFSLVGSVLALWCIARLASQSGLLWVALLSLHPLIVKEWYQSVHYDMWLVAAIALTLRSVKLKGLWLGISVNLKWVTLPLLATLPPKEGIRISWGIVLGVCCGILIPWAFFFRDLPMVWESLSTFGTTWEMNSGVFRWLRGLFYWLDWSPVWGPRVCVGILWVGFDLWYFSRESDSRRRAFWMLWSMVVISPVVNTWYLTWSLPLLYFLPSQQRLWMAFGFAWFPLSYAFYGYEPGQGLEVFWNLEHGIILAAAIAGLRSLRGWGAKKNAVKG